MSMKTNTTPFGTSSCQRIGVEFLLSSCILGCENVLQVQTKKSVSFSSWVRQPCAVSWVIAPSYHEWIPNSRLSERNNGVKDFFSDRRQSLIARKENAAFVFFILFSYTVRLIPKGHKLVHLACTQCIVLPLTPIEGWIVRRLGTRQFWSPAANLEIVKFIGWPTLRDNYGAGLVT